MSNPAVTQWLQEIAAAKAKTQAKVAMVATDSSSTTASTTTTATASATDKVGLTQSTFGIITSYNLKTKKQQLRLILPPEPVKPGPGECCGNDCDPCINTLYWEDLAAYRERVQKLKAEYEVACRALESGIEVGLGEKGRRAEQEGQDGRMHADDADGLSIRSYRSFKVLRKQYLTENTLLIICDLPYPTPVATAASHGRDTEYAVARAMFHILIRFHIKGDQFLTKAFTPIDLSTSTYSSDLKDRMAFLVKLYPSPHVTSDMFRQLQKYDAAALEEESNDGYGVLYLRGPIQTARDQQTNRETTAAAASAATMQASNQSSKGVRGDARKRERIVMIAAGSGITPMYQMLKAIHQEQRQHQHEQEQRPLKELDLIYCNRTLSEIWLRQEIQEICFPNRREAMLELQSMKELSVADRIGLKSADVVMTKRVHVQHILSCREEHDRQLGRRMQHHQAEQLHIGGRITLELLQNSLQQSTVRDDGVGSDSKGSASVETLNEKTKEEYLQIFVCGPPSFNVDVSKMLAQLGYANSDTCEIHVLE
ncbi:hypothetical protein EDD21DRAFT_369388 [Dissophora ornata]|nr:hypothetical protein BGZ58_004753 [Dissophora ornata]KAI8603347.1 hypothetical protein EDD21DRAFT_369388 [Dissophora ornata]